MATRKRFRVTTPEGRLSYPALFVPTNGGFENQEPKYGVEVIIPKSTDVSDLKQACANTLLEQFPSEGSRPKTPLPIHDGDAINAKRVADGKDPRPEVAGAWVIKAKSKDKVAIVDENVQPIMDQAKIYGGCWVRISVTPFWFDKGVNNGLSFALNGVQFARDDTPFGNPFDVNAAFGPTGGMSTSEAEADALFT